MKTMCSMVVPHMAIERSLLREQQAVDRCNYRLSLDEDE